MGYVPPPPPRISGQLARLAAIYSIFPRHNGPADPVPPIRLNLDRHGLPRDYASYVWVTYKRVVPDDSPARRAFLHGPNGGAWTHPNFGQQMVMR